MHYALRFLQPKKKRQDGRWMIGRIWQMSLSLYLMVLTEEQANQIVSSNQPISKTASMSFRYTPTAKSGIPHLHIVANRIDNMGNTNDAHYIGERAVRAANIINDKRGWVQSEQRRNENIQQISEDCFSILKAMSKFDWTTYCQMLSAKGYDIKLTKDEKEVVKGYAIRKGNSIYKSSIFGKSRKLMPSKIKADMGWITCF